MLTRKKEKESVKGVNKISEEIEGEVSDHSESLENTLVEIKTSEMENSSNVSITQDQFATLLASINTLKQSVSELSRETQQIRSEVRMCDKNTITSHMPNDPGKGSQVDGAVATVEENRINVLTQNNHHTSILPPLSSTPLAVGGVQSRPEYQQSQVHCLEPSVPQFHQPSTQYRQPESSSNQFVQQQPSNTTLQQRGMVSFVDNVAAKLYPLPTFDGNPEDWPLFSASYRDTTSEFGYNNRQNLMRLQKALQGYARRVVSSLLIYPDNVPLILEELQFNFGRPELLIRVQMQKIQQFPVINESRLEQVVEFSNQVRNVVAFLKSANCEHHLLNPMLLEQLILKLPLSKQFEWSRYAAKILPYPTTQTFADWISDLARVVSLMPSISSSSQRSNQPPSSARRSDTQTVSNRSMNSNTSRRFLYGTETEVNRQQSSKQETQTSCIKCQQSHRLVVCKEFKALSIHNRWKLVKANRLCFSYLQRGHSLLECRSKRVCGLDECSRMHNQLLHQPVNTSNITPSSVQPVATLAEQNDNEHLLNCRTHEPNTCLFKILPVILIGSRTCIKVYAMFDEGSSITLLEENIANELGVKGHAVPLTLQWYNDNQITEKSRVINLEIKGEHENISFQLKNVHTIKSLDLPIQTFNRNQFREFANLPIANYNAVRPSLLIGLDNSHLSIPKQTVSVGINQPIAVDTPLGWVVYGPALAKINLTSHVFHVRKSYTTHNLHQLLEEYFSIEGFGVKYIDTTLESAEDTRAREILFATTKNIGQRYQVGLLWREDHISLPQSYEMAKRRLIKVENKMSKDETYAKFYKAEMNKYIDKGYAKLLSAEEAQHEGPTTWYLPHFGVVNPHKPHKLRIVFDAAAAVSNISLNSMLLKGPERAQPLMTIMFKFRQRKIAVAGDIEEMFSQVKIRHADIHSQRFLWRDGNPLKDIQVYVMTSMIFGAACSPCCAEYIKNFNANQFSEVMPQGVKAVTKNTYVDDLVISFDNVNEASEVITEAIAINNAAGFRLRNFVSNCKELQHNLNDNADIQLNVVNMERQPKTDKILGMYWNSNSDVLEFQFKFHKIPRDVIEGNRSPTKRELLGLVMAIYDPFGLLANITIAAKLILQATWKQQIDWDDPLPSELESHWVMWWKAFQDVKHFSVPRCFSPNYSTAKSLQLHIFVDASDTAYAAVAYLRIKEAHDIDAAFIAARTRCAPKRELTVPRLELQAAVLGSRLKISIEECLDRNIDVVTFWSDSKTVLLWIRSMKRDFKPFVSCRISEILSTTTPRQWRWIPSALNVADEATKIKPFPVGLTNSRWVKGPAFLYDNEDRWPIEPPYLYSNLCDAEVCKENALLIISNNDFIDILKYSSFTKLLRVVAWVLRFINNLKLKSRLLGELLPKELSSAENFVCRQAQLQFYEIEINALQTGRIVDVTTAKDGQVRSANVRTRHGIIRRPASKLAAINL